jgi:hypothetical protein
MKDPIHPLLRKWLKEAEKEGTAKFHSSEWVEIFRLLGENESPLKYNNSCYSFSIVLDWQPSITA